MLKYIVSYFVLTAFFAVLGFSLLADTGATIAKVGFAFFLVMFLGSLLYRPERRRSEI